MSSERYPMKMSLLIIVPVYNEASGLKHFVSEVVSKVGADFDLLLVNDGSQDDSLSQIKSLAQQNERIFYLSFSRNFGHQTALRAGLDQAKGYEKIVMMDADLQHPPEVINEMLAKYQEGYKVVYTKRLKGEEGFLKSMTSRLFYLILNSLMEFKIESGTADFRLVDHTVLKVIQDHHEADLFLRGMMPYLGFKQTCLEYHPHERFAGKTKYTFKKMMRLAISGVTSFSDRPLYFSIYTGLIAILIALLYLSYAISQKISGGSVNGWASTIGAIVFIGGTQLIVLGVLGIYLGKIFFEVKKRPHYFIAEQKLK